MNELQEKLNGLKRDLSDAEWELAEIEAFMKDEDDDSDDYDIMLSTQEAYCESLQEMIAECERQIVDEQYDKIAERHLLKEEKKFKEVQWDRKCRWLEGCLQRSPKDYVSPYQKAERNKRKRRAAMKRSFAWTVI